MIDALWYILFYYYTDVNDLILSNVQYACILYFSSETEGGVQTDFVLILDMTYSVESLQDFLKHEVEQNGGRLEWHGMRWHYEHKWYDMGYNMGNDLWQDDIKVNVSSITIAQGECLLWIGRVDEGTWFNVSVSWNVIFDMITSQETCFVFVTNILAAL